MIKWILWTFVKGLEFISISIITLGLTALLVGLASVLIWYGLISKEYLILSEIIVGCIFIFGLIFRAVWEIKLPSQLRKL